MKLWVRSGRIVILISILVASQGIAFAQAPANTPSDPGNPQDQAVSESTDQVAEPNGQPGGSQGQAPQVSNPAPSPGQPVSTPEAFSPPPIPTSAKPIIAPPKTSITTQVGSDQVQPAQPPAAQIPVLQPQTKIQTLPAPQSTQSPGMALSKQPAVIPGAPKTPPGLPPPPAPFSAFPGPYEILQPQASFPVLQPVPPRPNLPAGAPGQPMQPPPMPPQGTTVTSIVESGKKLYNLNFDDADIYSIIHTIFGDVLKVNYVIDSRIKGRASFKSVSRIPQENVLPMMEVILRLNGVAVVEEHDLYRILPISEIAREPSPVAFGRDEKSIAVKGKALLQVIPINNIQSSEMVRLISPFLSVHASVVDVPKINGIVIVDTDANVKRVLRLIEIFDSELQKRKGPQVFVYPVQHSKAKDISNLLQQIFLSSKPGTAPKYSTTSTPSGQFSPSSTTRPSTPAPPQPVTRTQQSYTPPTHPQVSMAAGSESLVSDIVKIFYDDIINSVIILGTPEDYAIIQETIKKIDIIPRQVLIEGTIAEINMTDKMSLGLRWALTGKAFGTNIGISLNPSNTRSTAGLEIIGTDSSGNIQVLINALAADSKAKLLASPHIMVSDNREARIQVGQSVPIPTAETYGTPGIAPQRTIQYKDIGIILKVKPQISDSGQVTLDLSQEVSTYSTIALYSNETQIILNKTDASTSLVVQDGQTIIIGGLIREDRTGSRTGIPFLTKIPVIGFLFGNSEREEIRKEMVILLTPRVIKSQMAASSVTSEIVEKFTKTGTKKGIKKEELLKENGSPPEEIKKAIDQK